MALNRPWSRDIFSQSWVDNLKGSPERAMVAAVQFYDPALSTSVYDSATNTYTSTPVILLSCKARVQPMRSANQKSALANDTTVQSVLVSIPIDLGLNLDLRPRHRAKVTVSPLMPVLTKFIFVANEVLDSSNPLERTFLFTVDLEAVQA